MRQTTTHPSVLLILLGLLAACGAPASTPAPAPAEATIAPAPAEAAPAPSAPGGKRTFVIVPAESKASFIMDEEFFGGALDKLGIPAGKVNPVGTTQAIAGQLELDLDNLDAALGDNSFTVQMNTFTTDQPMRDQWIREDGPKFNDYPDATFKATAIEGAPGSYTEGEEVSFKLIGDITIREITQPATFDVTAKLSGDTLTGVAKTRLLLSAFEIGPLNFANTLTVADEFGVEVEFTARSQ